MKTEESGDEGSEGYEELVPKIIDEEFLTALWQNANTIIKKLQSKQEDFFADEFQKCTIVCQRFKKELESQEVAIDGLKKDIAVSNEKLRESYRNSQIDYKTIDSLRSEIENAWKKADASQEREQTAYDQLYAIQEKMEVMNEELQKLTEKRDLVEQSGVSKHKEGILKERDRLVAEVKDLNRRQQIQRVHIEEVEQKRQELEHKNKELYKILDENSSEAFKDRRILDQTKSQLKEVTIERNAISEEAKTLKQQTEKHLKTTVQQNLQILAVRTNLERINTQHTIASNKLIKAIADLEQLGQLKDKLQNDLNQKANLLKLREDENAKQRQDIAKLMKEKELLTKKYQSNEQLKISSEQQLLKLRNQETVHEKAIDVSKKIIEKLKFQVETTIHERDLIKNDLTKVNQEISEHNNNINIAHQKIRNLKFQIKALNQSALKHKATLKKLQLDKDRFFEENKTLIEKVSSLQYDIHFNEKYFMELKGNVTELQLKLVQNQSLLESTRNERNSFEKNCQNISEERNELKRKLQETLKKIEDLKEEIGNKDEEILRFQKLTEKSEKEHHLLKIAGRNIEVILQHTRSELKAKRQENDQLYKTLADEEQRYSKLEKCLNEVIHEKELMTRELVAKTDEAEQFKEKLQMLQIDFDRQEIELRKKLSDIRILKVEIRNLQGQRNVLSRGLANTIDMRQEVLQLNRAVNQERVKSKALEEEMMTPMNVHRWRSLSGKDPEKMELIIKVQALQKRILSQSITVQDREEALEAAHRLYFTLKQFMLKLPSYKDKEELNETKHELTIRTRKLKALAAELNAKGLDNRAKDCMLEELRTSLSSAKNDLVGERKQKQKLIAEREIIYQVQKSFSAPPTTNKTKYLVPDLK